MKREAFDLILEWSKSKNRQPLVLRGARQVGKSFLVRWLARQHFTNLVEVNFEKNPEVFAAFKSNDVVQIINELEIFFGVSIKAGATLLFLDEIQVYPELLAKLRWFSEDMPDLHVVAAGSLLDFALSEQSLSMPVGRVSFLYLDPFSFNEFLDALGENKLAEFIRNYDLTKTISPLIHAKLTELLKTYFLVGGMPKGIRTYRDTKKLTVIERVHSDLMESFRNDFNKYRNRLPAERLRVTLQSIPEQLGKKFTYSRVSQEERGSAVKAALELLLNARLAYKVESSHCDGIPLGSQVDSKNSKVFLLDVGVCNYLLGLNLSDFRSGENIMFVNAGSIAEQFVSQMFHFVEAKHKDPRLFYWVREKSGADAEVDFVIQKGQEIIPVEVKAGKSGTLKSLHLMVAQKKLKRAIRFNSEPPLVSTIATPDNYKFKLISLPLYLAERISELI